MRKFHYLILIITVACLILIGCQNSKPTSPQPENKNETRLIKAVPRESIETKNMTKLDEFPYDLDLDGSEEKVELFTAAERNENGEIVWDDGQNWLLVVWDGEKAYPILSQYVQLGSVYFTVSNNGMDEVSNITVIVPTGAGFSLKTYVFDNIRNGFEVELIYTSKDNNYFHNSIPTY